MRWRPAERERERERESYCIIIVIIMGGKSAGPWEARLCGARSTRNYKQTERSYVFIQELQQSIMLSVLTFNPHYIVLDNRLIVAYYIMNRLIPKETDQCVSLTSEFKIPSSVRPERVAR